jgi:GrpB-like predicted nucleotidyltransferase (UPF0157 family)
MAASDTSLLALVSEPAVRARVAVLFERERRRIAAALPDAQIEHVGATAIPGALTKGDLDLNVRVAGARFAAAEAALAGLYARNTASDHSATFAAFTDDALDLGVQLTAIGSAEDFFLRQRDRLLADPRLCAAYDDLKRRFAGQRMVDYRAAKEAFWREVAGD